MRSKNNGGASLPQSDNASRFHLAGLRLGRTVSEKLAALPEIIINRGVGEPKEIRANT